MKLSSEEKRLIPLIEETESEILRLSFVRRPTLINHWQERREALLDELYKARPWRAERAA